jgi:fido (protein-threonine AMPylation protein)
LSFVNENMAEVKELDQIERPSKMIALAALFFCEFLKIHPFINGNGRTVRLLLSWLIRDETGVPVSLMTCREKYMDAVANG